MNTFQVTYDKLRAGPATKAYALGYYHGLAIGQENNVFVNDLDRHMYKQGYDAGVTDWRGRSTPGWHKDLKEEN